jgi:hypothetical protein
VIALVKRMPEPQQTRVLSELAPLRATIRDAGIFDWLPAEVHVQLIETVQRGLREHESTAFWSDLLLDGYSRPPLSALVSRALQTYGDSPESFLRLAPHVWSRVTRNAGIVSYSPGGGSGGSVRFAGLAPVIDSSTAMLSFLSGGLESAYAYFGMSGTVVTARRAAGEVDYQVAWKCR